MLPPPPRPQSRPAVRTRSSLGHESLSRAGVARYCSISNSQAVLPDCDYPVKPVALKLYVRTKLRGKTPYTLLPGIGLGLSKSRPGCTRAVQNRGRNGG